MNIDATPLSGGTTAGGLTSLSDEDLLQRITSTLGNDATSEQIDEVVKQIISEQG